jgi:hypothetical protein
MDGVPQLPVIPGAGPVGRKSVSGPGAKDGVYRHHDSKPRRQSSGDARLLPLV